MRAVAVLALAATACASVSARENDKATPVARNVEDDQPARLPDAPAAETAERLIDACSSAARDVTDCLMVVDVNLQSADNQRVKKALAVLDAMASSIDARNRKWSADEDYVLLEPLERIVDHVRSAIDDRLKTASCSLIFAVENIAGRFGRLPGFVPRRAHHSPFEDHSLSLRTLWCGLETINDKVAACGATHKGSDRSYVDVGVGTDGTVTSAVVRGTLANTPVGNCVSAAARTATFPPSLGGSFDYPFGLK